MPDSVRPEHMNADGLMLGTHDGTIAVEPPKARLKNTDKTTDGFKNHHLYEPRNWTPDTNARRLRRSKAFQRYLRGED